MTYILHKKFGVTRHKQTWKHPLSKNVNKISLSLVLLNFYQLAVTQRMDHNSTYKDQVAEVFEFNMTNNAHEFMPPLLCIWTLKIPKVQSANILKRPITITACLDFSLLQTACRFCVWLQKQRVQIRSIFKVLTFERTIKWVEAFLT